VKYSRYSRIKIDNSFSYKEDSNENPTLPQKTNHSSVLVFLFFRYSSYCQHDFFSESWWEARKGILTQEASKKDHSSVPSCNANVVWNEDLPSSIFQDWGIPSGIDLSEEILCQPPTSVQVSVSMVNMGEYSTEVCCTLFILSQRAVQGKPILNYSVEVFSVPSKSQNNMKRTAHLDQT